MQVMLTVIDGPHTGRTFAFDRHDHFFVGRAKFAQFQMPSGDPYFSRMHLLIEVNPPVCRLLDLDSTNGTLVNGNPVRMADLQHGDRIEAGTTVFRITIHDEYRTQVPAVTPVSQEELPATVLRPGPAPAAGPTPIPPLRDPVNHGWQLPGYELKGVIGRGNMGVVYRAVRLADRQDVAVKMIQPKVAASAEDRQRFLREVEILRQLEHPAIVRMLEAGDADGVLYFCMELIEGVDARQFVERQPKLLAPRVAVGIATRVLKALEHAHERGFVHRDVKPANILISKRGNQLDVKLTDFGLARAYEQSRLSGLTLTGDLCGTPAFMAPEQITDCRHVTPASDQYSIAATLYWLLTKCTPHDFTGVIQQDLNRILLEDPVPIAARRPDTSVGLALAVHRALNKKTEDRFASAGEYQSVLSSELRKATD